MLNFFVIPLMRWIPITIGLGVVILVLVKHIGSLKKNKIDSYIFQDVQEGQAT